MFYYCYYLQFIECVLSRSSTFFNGNCINCGMRALAYIECVVCVRSFVRKRPLDSTMLTNVSSIFLRIYNFAIVQLQVHCARQARFSINVKYCNSKKHVSCHTYIYLHHNVIKLNLFVYFVAYFLSLSRSDLFACLSFVWRYHESNEISRTQ